MNSAKYPRMQNTELDFLKDNLDTQRCILACGVKGSSKTFTMLNLVKFLMLSGKYFNFYLILPSYENDQHVEQFEFLKHTPPGVNVKIFTSYSQIIMEYIVDFQRKDGRTAMCVVDDSTSFMQEFSNDPNFIKAFTTSRHIKMLMYVICHSLKSVIVPKIRNNVDYILLYKVSNANLLESFYEEYMSMFERDFKNFKEFKIFYVDHILERKYNGFFLNLQEDKYYPAIVDFFINTYDFNKHFEGVKKKVKIIEDEAQ